MQQDYVPRLGDEFTALASRECGTSPYTSKLVLYSVLDDGYGRYFNEIFNEDDKLIPYFIQDIGTPFQERLRRQREACVKLAVQYVADKKLNIAEWRSSWRRTALRDGVEDKIARYPAGGLGNAFISYLGGRLSLVDSLVAKQALCDFISCGAAVQKVFTPQERASFLYSSLSAGATWYPQSLCSKEFFEKVSSAAAAFASQELGMAEHKATFVGVTFGWTAKHGNEWHLYGDLVTANLFSCKAEALPGLFGVVSATAPPSMIEAMYNATYLCVVAVESEVRSFPEMLDDVMIYNFPTSAITSCKWVGRLPSILGPYKLHKREISAGIRKAKKEGIYSG